jgi:hypothetical protein
MKLALNAVEPFNFELSVEIFFGGDRYIRRYEDRRFWRVLRVDGKLILMIV